MTLKIPETPHDRMLIVFCKIHFIAFLGYKLNYETFVASVTFSRNNNLAFDIPMYLIGRLIYCKTCCVCG